MISSGWWHLSTVSFGTIALKVSYILMIALLFQVLLGGFKVYVIGITFHDIPQC